MTAYRETALLCPMCHEALEACSIESAASAVDLCGSCGGVWMDWEDGDFTALARKVPSTTTRVMPANGPGPCPRCNCALAVEVFLDTAEVLRCGECAGAFMPHASIGKIAACTPAAAREDGRENVGEATLWQRAAAALREWMKGLSAPRGL